MYIYIYIYIYTCVYMYTYHILTCALNNSSHVAVFGTTAMKSTRKQNEAGG